MGILSGRPDEPKDAIFNPAQLDQLKALVEILQPKGDPLAMKLLEDLKDTYGRTVIKANVEGNGLSPFVMKDGCEFCVTGRKHPDGRYAHEKPKMKYQAFQCGVPMRDEQLDVVEVELLNAFTSNREARNGNWTARIDQTGTHPRLLINFPASDIMQMDNIPPLKLLLMELLHGKEYVDPNNLHDQIKRLTERLAQLEGAQPATA